MPTLTIDGHEVTVEDGTNLVEAAKRVGVEIPTFCYHRKLSVAANCRMCLVKGRQNGRDWPKPMPACQMVAAEGMEIDASSHEVKRLRKAVLEFILINHPLDCPICDKSGECDLQDNYFKHSNQPSRFAEVKEEKVKRVDLGPRIVYDGERCITCTRCVRFMAEIAKSPQLGVIHRGDKALICTAAGEAFDHPYSVNTVDLCPVGALTDKAFRFKQRAWFLKVTPSVCTGCARGCSTYIDSSTIDGRVYRVRPRLNDHVNGEWMCDEGRLTFAQVHEQRMSAARVKKEQVDLDEALRAATEQLQPYIGAEELAVAISATVSCEDAAAACDLVAEVLDLEQVCITGRRDGQGDNFLRLADQNANRAGVKKIVQARGLKLESADALLARVEAGEVKAALLVGSEWPAEDLDRVAAALARLPVCVVLAAHDDAVSQAAGVALPACGFAETEACVVNADGRLQARHVAIAAPGVSQPAWKLLALLARQSGHDLEIDRHEAAFALVRRQLGGLDETPFANIPAEGLALDGETQAPRFAGDK